MNSTELKQQAILAHRETCFFRNKKGGCETAVKKTRICDDGCEYMRSFLSKIEQKKVNLNILAEVSVRSCQKRGKISPNTTNKQQANIILQEVKELQNAEGKSEHLQGYSAEEEESADIIIAALTYLQQICKTSDIGMLIIDKLTYNKNRDD